MAYCTVNDLVVRFGEREIINLSAPGQQAINNAVIDKAIADASAEIDSYFSSRYQLPLTPIPTVLARTCANMARYYLYNDKMNDAVKVSYDGSIRFLRDVSKGVVSLGVDAAGNSATQTESLAVVQSDKVVWSRKDSNGFI